MKHFLLTLMLASHGLMAHAAGTIAFKNSFRPMQWIWNSNGPQVPVPTIPGLVFYGVFWGTNYAEMTQAWPLGINATTTAGLIDVPNQIGRAHV